MKESAADVTGSGKQGGDAKTVRWESSFAGVACGILIEICLSIISRNGQVASSVPHACGKLGVTFLFRIIHLGVNFADN